MTACTSSSTSNQKNNYVVVTGQTMGTTYSIKVNTQLDDLKQQIDSLLLDFNAVFSTYDSNSVITYINNSHEDSICIDDSNQLFLNTLKLANEVWTNTNGYFDPTVMPLVKYWGFGPKKNILQYTNQEKIDSILFIIGLNKVKWSQSDEQLCLFKAVKNLSIDLNAIAKGKGVDVICQWFDSLGIENYMVEIGGEIRTKGVNDRNEAWRIGIDKPINTDNLNDRQSQAIIQLNNQAIASSGNYRNFHEVNGKIVGHTINPKTGYAELNDLLGVSVIAENCATADAYATGFMAMGFNPAFETADKIDAIKVLFIKLSEDGNTVEIKTTNGFKEHIVSMN